MQVCEGKMSNVGVFLCVVFHYFLTKIIIEQKKCVTQTKYFPPVLCLSTVYSTTTTTHVIEKKVINFMENGLKQNMIVLSSFENECHRTKIYSF